MSSGARRFVRRVARVYEEVLESKPNSLTDDPFLAALRLIAGEAGIALPRDPEALSTALQDR
jgi:hypothetical protein